MKNNCIGKNIDKYFFLKRNAKGKKMQKLMLQQYDREIEFKIKTRKEKDEFKKVPEFYSLERLTHKKENN